MASPLPPDPYGLLGVPKDAKLSEIRSAHRKLVLKCHPDKVQDAALKAVKQDEFQKVQQAYELLSDDNRRLRYDEQVKLFELRKEMGRGVPAGRTNPFDYEVKTAEPRSSTFTYTRSKPREMPRETTKVYPQQQQPRSYEDVAYDEPVRTAKKSASYESADRKQRSARDEERQRDIWQHEEDERVRQKAEKESRRAAHEERKKSRDKEKRRGAEEKHSRTTAYVEDESSDEYPAPPPRPGKKASRQRMEEDARTRTEEAARTAEKSIRQAPLTPKWDDHKEYAAQYMQAARRKAVPDDDFHPRPIQRAETFTAPETKYNLRYAAPQPAHFSPSDEDLPRRSAAPQTSRRSSETPPTRSRDLPKSSSKDKERRKSPRERSNDPYIVEPPSPPPVAKKPTLQTHSSAPPIINGFAARREPSRSKTQDYPRQDAAAPPLPRAATFQSGDRADRGRGGSRLKKTVDYTTDSEPESSPIYASPRHSHSPQPRRRDAPEPTRYIIDNGRSVPISRHRSEMRNIDDEAPYARDRSESPRGGGRHSGERPPITRNPGSGGSRQAPVRSHSQAYYAPEAPEPIVLTARPKMPPRETGHGHSRSAGRGSGPYFGEVQYTANYGPEHVVYNEAYRRGSDPSHARDYGYAAPRGERVYA